MRSLTRLVAATLAALAAVATLGLGHARAQDQSTITKMQGTTIGSGTWTRTITDVEPNGTQATFNILVPWSPGLSADSMAARYRQAANATLPGPQTGPTGYGTANQLYRDFAGVRLARQGLTYLYADASPPTGITMSTNPPLNAEDAPIASPAGLAALAAGLAGLAWWRRRRLPG